jgi:phosphoserine phosphatase RsbU/P
MPVSAFPMRRLPPGVQEVLDAFRRAHEVEVRMWQADGDFWQLIDPIGFSDGAPPPDALSLAEGKYRIDVSGPSPEAADRALGLLATVLERLLGMDQEIRQMSDEIAERYEEITLLYSISETLGSVISLKDAARTILSEVIATIGAHRAALWVHDDVRDVLYLAAEVGMNGQNGPIRIDDPTSATAAVFRERRAKLMDPDDKFERGPYDRGITQRGYFLSVPVSYTPPHGDTRTVGVINLVGRETDEPFNAGDLQLLSAIASQVGAAVENRRLVAASLRQERLVRELELAHDLQLKLLPSTDRFADYAEVVARCIPADTVGGDFYHLFRLSHGRLGVMIGDVSSHGFSAALIMALTMSAVAIHASEGDPPAEVLRRVHHALIEELESTEMYLTLFYGVIDPAAGRITYANAGHHHAFRFDSEGRRERLKATNPPFGIIDLDTYSEASAEWHAGEDLLFLFTDGLPDALGSGEKGENQLLDMVSGGRSRDFATLLDDLFALTVPAEPRPPHDDRTALLVRL